jgi:hypothetical protein
MSMGTTFYILSTHPIPRPPLPGIKRRISFL